MQLIAKHQVDSDLVSLSGMFKKTFKSRFIPTSFSQILKWDESLVSRGQTGEGTNSGSFAPREGGQSETVVGLKETSDSLPKTPPTSDPRQPAKTKADVYASAQAAHAEIRSWLDEGSGAATSLGYRNMKGGPDQVSAEEYKRPGGMLFIDKLKGLERAEEKVAKDYKGDWSQLKDVVRATVAVDNFRDMGTFLRKMQESGVKIEKVKNRFMNPTKDGVRDILMNVRFSNGHVGELQVHLKPLLQAKNEAHHYYQTMRHLSALHDNSDPGTWRAEDRAIYDHAHKASLAIYNSAWNNVVASSNPSKGQQRLSNLGGSRSMKQRIGSRGALG